MKYILLFEAFKSEILSATLNHLSVTGRGLFLDEINKISEAIDFPKSEITDDFFSYVPNVGDRAKNIRTDISLEDDNCLKFWFDIKGNYIATTTVRKSKGGSKEGYKVVDTYTSLSKLLEDSKPQLIEENGKFRYIPGKIKTGDKFWIKLESVYLLATAYIQTIFDLENQVSQNSLYMIQNYYDGATPNSLKYLTDNAGASRIESEVKLEDGTTLYVLDNGRSMISENWKQYGDYSWMITSRSDYQGNPELLEPTGDKVIERKENLVYYWYDKRINVDTGGNFEEVIKKAHFALVLDFKKLKESNYKKKSEIGKERGELKKGVITPDKYAEIKKMNIQRYFDKISQKIQIDPEFKNLDDMFWKIFSRRTILIDILNETTSVDEYYKFIRRISEFIVEREYEPEMPEIRINYLLGNITDGLKKAYIKSSEDASKYSESESDLRRYLNSERSRYPEIVAKMLIFVDKFLEVCDSFANQVSLFEKESIDDLQLLKLKFKSVKELGDMDSYSTFKIFLKDIFVGWNKIFRNPNLDNLLSWSSKDELLNRIEKGTNELEKFKKQINKLI